MTSALTEIIDRHGFVHARLSWNDGELVELVVPGAIVRGATVDDPLLGRAHEIVAAETAESSARTESRDSTSARSNVLTTISAIDWARPTEIPAIGAPGKLPPGVGGAIMNVLAILAQRAGITELHYAGPYPTNALWSTLMRSFTTTSSEDEFTAAFAERAARVARDPMPAVFVPAPHERLAIIEGDADEEQVRGIVEIRNGMERTTIDGVTYARGDGIARLDIGEIKHGHRVDDRRAHDGHVRAEVWFADELYAHVATFDANGTLVDGPHPIPACESDNVGKAFPPEMVAALAELIAELVPPPLATAATHAVAGRTLRWADLGARAAVRVGAELHLHAALWRLAPKGMARVAMALVEALAPIVTPLAAASVAAIV